MARKEESGNLEEEGVVVVVVVVDKEGKSDLDIFSHGLMASNDC